MKMSKLLLLALLFSSLVACIKEEIDFDNLSGEIELERDIAMPLMHGSLQFEDFSDRDYDSLLIIDNDTIKLYLVENIGFTDTLPMTDLGTDIVFEFMNLHYEFINQLPVGLDIQFYLFDSIQSQNIDTIFLSDIPGKLFLDPAPVDNNGIVIDDQVVTTTGFVSFDEEKLDRFFNETTHLIFDAIVPSTGGYVKILDYYSLDFRLGIEARGTWVTDLDSIN